MVIFHSFMYVYQAGYARSVSSISDIQISTRIFEISFKMSRLYIWPRNHCGIWGRLKNEGNAQQKPGSSSSGSQFHCFFNGNTTCRDKFMLAMVKSRITSYIITYKYHCWWFQPNPSEKWWSSSVGMIIPNIWKNKKSKRPTKYIHIHIYIYIYTANVSPSDTVSLPDLPLTPLPPALEMRRRIARSFRENATSTTWNRKLGSFTHLILCMNILSFLLPEKDGFAGPWSVHWCCTTCSRPKVLFNPTICYSGLPTCR